MVMTSTNRKRKLSVLDGDSRPSKKEAKKETSVMRRRSQRKTPASPEKENCPSPLKPAAKSPFKPSLAPTSFYGKQKSVYLTPLQRKTLKESLPPPPPPSTTTLVLSSSLAKKPVKKRGKRSHQKAAAGSAKPRDVRVNASAKRITLPKLSSSVVKAPPPPAPPGSSKAVQSCRKPFIFSFGSMRPKPKILVGAAFFSTGKKHQTRKQPPPPRPALHSKHQQQDQHQQQQQQTLPLQREEERKKQRSEVNPADDWVDYDAAEPKTPPPLSSPKVLAERFGITRDLKVVLSRTPTTSPVQSPNTEGSCDSELVSPDRPGSPTEPAAVYPIFGSASKRRKCASLQRPLVSAESPAAAVKEAGGRRRKEKQDEDQLIIDAGQKQFGATACSSCGMVYSQENPEDAFQHAAFHQRLLRSIRYVGWKKERLVAEFWDGKILLVMPSDSKYALKKAEEVRRVVDNELGFQQPTLANLSQTRTYLFINSQQLVVGCLLAEPIRRAYRVLQQANQQADQKRDNFLEPQRAWCCSTVPQPALCGVSRIWCFSQARRQGVATRMLDTLRYSFLYGCHLTKDEIAFSDPTPDGKQFASKYCDTPAFLVYNSV